jgi:hypothetical protein
LSHKDSNFKPVRFDRPRKHMTCAFLFVLASGAECCTIQGTLSITPRRVVYTLLCDVLFNTAILEAHTDMKMLTSVLFWWHFLLSWSAIKRRTNWPVSFVQVYYSYQIVSMVIKTIIKCVFWSFQRLLSYLLY